MSYHASKPLQQGPRSAIVAPSIPPSLSLPWLPYHLCCSSSRFLPTFFRSLLSYHLTRGNFPGHRVKTIICHHALNFTRSWLSFCLSTFRQKSFRGFFLSSGLSVKVNSIGRRTLRVLLGSQHLERQPSISIRSRSK